MDEKISVIIPVYKVEPYLRQCLDSVVQQTYRALEIILVDDGSPDNCGAICDEYAKRDARIQVIHKENGGLCAARNDGIQRAAGEWIAFVDSDDWCELDYYAELMKAMGDQRPDIFFAGGRIFEYPDESRVGRYFSAPFCRAGKEQMEELMKGIVSPPDRRAGSYGAPWDKLYRREFIEENHLRFDVSSKAWEDLWFNFQAFDRARTVCGCTYVGYHYRILTTSITGKYNPQRPAINYDFVCKLRDYAQRNGKSDSLLQAMRAHALAMFKHTLDFYYFHPQNDLPGEAVARGVRELKSRPYYREAIAEGRNPYLTRRQRLLKLLLRIPSIGPLRIAYAIEKKMGN